MNEIQRAIEVLQGCLEHPGADDAIAGLRAMMVQPAHTAQREPLTDYECDKVVAQAIEAEARRWDIPTDCLNANVSRNISLGRAIVRAAHGITKGDT